MSLSCGSPGSRSPTWQSSGSLAASAKPSSSRGGLRGSGVAASRQRLSRRNAHLTRPRGAAATAGDSPCSAPQQTAPRRFATAEAAAENQPVGPRRKPGAARVRQAPWPSGGGFPEPVRRAAAAPGRTPLPTPPISIRDLPNRVTCHPDARICSALEPRHLGYRSSAAKDEPAAYERRPHDLGA